MDCLLTTVRPLSMFHCCVVCDLASAPLVTHSDMTNGPASGSANITLSGVNFGENDLTATAHVMVTVCKTSSWSSATGLVCESPVGSGVGGFLSVRVTSAVLVGTHSGVFTTDCTFVSYGNKLF